MASRVRTFRLPPALDEAVELRAKQLGYPDASSYLKGLARYDMVVQGPHDLTLPWASKPVREQDEIDEMLLANTKKGVGQRGQLLRRIIEEKLQNDKTTKRPRKPPVKEAGA